MPNPIDFKNTPRLTPKPDSWGKVLSRIEAEKASQETVYFRLFSSFSAVASILFVASGVFFGLSSNRNTLQQPTETLTDSETISWFSSLGEGNSIEEISTIFDEYK
ncbi:MAG TPA: hypothetical protein GX724_04325 [Fibrobacter sp.]|nr:hypothetical protein [Fibrobacter sp.]